MLKNLLVMRMALLNIVLFALVGAAATQGWVQYVYQNDHSHLTYGITAFFLINLIGCFFRAQKTASALNQLKDHSYEDQMEFRRDVSKMPIKNAYLSHASSILTGLGICGTVIGMSLIATTIDPTNINVGKLLSGVSVSFMCTLVAIGHAMWLELNVTMLNTATSLLVKDAGE